MDPFIPFVFIFGIAGYEMIWKNRSQSLRSVVGNIAIFYIISLVLITIVSFPTNPEPNNNPAVALLYHFSPIPNFAYPVILVPLFLLGWWYGVMRKGLPPASLISVLLILSLLYSAPPVYDEMFVSQKSVVLLEFCDRLNQISHPQDRFIWDSSTETGPNDSISFASLKFWLGGRMFERNVSLITLQDGRQGLSIPEMDRAEFLITKKEYPMKKIVKLADYYFYSFT